MPGNYPEESTQQVFVLLLDERLETLCFSPDIESYILCLFSHNNVIWCNILGTISWQHKGIVITEKSD